MSGRTLTPIQERVVLITQMRLDKARLLEAQINMMSVDPGLMKKAGDVFEQLRDTLFPGLDEVKDEAMEAAKRMLAKEVKSVLLVKKKDDSVEGLRAMSKDGMLHPDVRADAARRVHAQEDKERRVRSRLQERRRANTAGVSYDEL